MKITNIPAEVYLVALDLMGIERPIDLTDVADTLRSAEGRCDYHQPRVDGTPLTAFGAALAMYVSLSGPFAEDGGEFAGVNGYSVQQ